MTEHHTDLDETFTPEEDIIEGEVVEPDSTLDGPTRPLAEEQASSSSEEEAADSVRAVRPQRIRQKSANRVAIFPLAMGFIGLGGLLFAEDYVDGLEVSLAASSIILIGALILTYLFRFFTSGRRERGLFFLATIAITWGALLALSVVDSETYPLAEFWPLIFAGVGSAFFLTFIFERSHQIGLVFPGVLLLFVSGVAFLVTLDVIDETIQDTVSDYWPLLLAFIGLTLLPSALQEDQ